MGTYTNEVKYRVMEWVKSSTFYGDLGILRGRAEFVKKVYASEIDGPHRKGKPLVRIG